MDEPNHEDRARREAFISYFRKRWGIGDAAQKKCAQDTGYTEGRISQIVRGIDRFGEQAAKNMATACGLDERSFLFAVPGDSLRNERPAHAEVLIDRASHFPVRRVTIKVSGGATGYAIDFIQDEDGEPVLRPTSWFRRHGYRPEKLIAMAVINGSMEPNYQSGDVLLVDTENTELKDGAPVVANFEGEPVLKRMQRDAGQWWLTSDNPDKARYPRKLFSECVTIVGRVVWMETEHV